VKAARIGYMTDGPSDEDAERDAQGQYHYTTPKCFDENPNWRELAACSKKRMSELEEFQPFDFCASPHSTAAKNALRICTGCVVKQQCLDFAIRNEIDSYIYGGLTAPQRRALK
jgi:WhiB family transcriptional regulator, redox-sensing transcriptional regulator